MCSIPVICCCCLQLPVWSVTSSSRCQVGLTAIHSFALAIFAPYPLLSDANGVLNLELCCLICASVHAVLGFQNSLVMLAQTCQGTVILQDVCTYV
jgi:hypothetical protein